MTPALGEGGIGAGGSPGGERSSGEGRPESEGGSKGDGREAATESEGADEVYYCDLCGNVMLNLHCKLICETCGYKRDCSDP